MVKQARQGSCAAVQPCGRALSSLLKGRNGYARPSSSSLHQPANESGNENENGNTSTATRPRLKLNGQSPDKRPTPVQTTDPHLLPPTTPDGHSLLALAVDAAAAVASPLFKYSYFLPKHTHAHKASSQNLTMVLLVATLALAAALVPNVAFAQVSDPPNLTPLASKHFDYTALVRLLLLFTFSLLLPSLALALPGRH